MRRPVEVIMDAGLGNEMFQYALGRALSIRLNRPLLLDISLIFQSPGWGYDLPCFKLAEHQLRDQKYPLWLARTKTLRKLGSLGLELITYVEEPSLLYWEGANEIGTPCILRGFWQSERYFESIGDTLREEFTFVHEQDARSAECQARIRRPHSIGLHVRRGDYLAGPGEEDFHGTCSKQYYDAALNIIRSRFGSDLQLFVFSDDIPWVRENIRYDIPTEYVDWNQERDYEDLRLMSQCHALIMANSTYSWWGGWLNNRPDKLIIAPRQWYRAPGAISELPNSSWLIAI